MDKLGVDRPTMEPKATEHIQEMIDLISELIAKDMAYPAGGDVYYSVNSFPGYGKLSGRNLEDMQAGARISVNENKNNPMDFVLWKASKPGEPSWESPWGAGRPGWSIEDGTKVVGDSAKVIAFSGIMANEVDRVPGFPDLLVFNCTGPDGTKRLADLILAHRD